MGQHWHIFSVLYPITLGHHICIRHVGLDHFLVES